MDSEWCIGKVGCYSVEKRLALSYAILFFYKEGSFFDGNSCLLHNSIRVDIALILLLPLLLNCRERSNGGLVFLPSHGDRGHSSREGASFFTIMGQLEKDVDCPSSARPKYDLKPLARCHRENAMACKVVYYA